MPVANGILARIKGIRDGGSSHTGPLLGLGLITEVIVEGVLTGLERRQDTHPSI